jgi:hypothetical protein
MTTPLYTSKCTAKNFWQEYQIFSDHLEFHTLYGKISIPFDEITSINLSESEIKGLMHGDLHLKGFKPAIKLDWANFTEHIVLDRSKGSFQRILFTPDQPEAFLLALEAALKSYRKE